MFELSEALCRLSKSGNRPSGSVKWWNKSVLNMAKSSPKQPAVGESKSVTRIDPPHPMPNVLSAGGVEASISPALPDPQVVLAAAGQSQETADEQLRMHASQLVSHLRDRQRDVDRRESLLHAQLAQQENELRSHRLWMREREADVSDRERDLRRQINELEQRIAGLSTVELSADQCIQDREQKIAERETDLAKRQFQLDERERRVTSEVTALHTAEQRFAEEHRQFAHQVRAEKQKLQFLQESLWQTHRRLLVNVERHRESLEQKERRLAKVQPIERVAGESLDEQLKGKRQQRETQDLEARLARREKQLDVQFAEFEQERRSLEREQVETREELERERQGLSVDRRQFREELAQGTARLEQRSESIEKQRIVLEQLHDECTTRHREALELRLAAEQAWADICGKASPASVTQTMAGIRRQLAEEFRDSMRSITEKKQEVCQLAEGLEKRRGELQARQADLQDWLAQRQQYIEAQAAQLHSREQELDRQDSEFAKASKQWAQERRQLQREIRELQSSQRRQLAAA